MAGADARFFGGDGGGGQREHSDDDAAEEIHLGRSMHAEELCAGAGRLGSELLGIIVMPSHTSHENGIGREHTFLPQGLDSYKDQVSGYSRMRVKSGQGTDGFHREQVGAPARISTRVSNVHVEAQAMPRPASPVWEHFRKEMPNKRATCSYCGANMCGLIVRMRTHLARRCDSCPESVKAEMTADLSRKLHHGSDADCRAPGPDDLAPGPVTRGCAGQQERPGRLRGQSHLRGGAAGGDRGAHGLCQDAQGHEPELPPAQCVRSGHVRAGPRVLGGANQTTRRGAGFHRGESGSGVVGAAEARTGDVCAQLAEPGDIRIRQHRRHDPHAGDARGQGGEYHDTDWNREGVGYCHGDYRLYEASVAHAGGQISDDHVPAELCAHDDRHDDGYAGPDPVARAAIARVAEQSIEAAAPMGDPTDTTPSGLLDCLFTIERNRHSLDILLAENGTLSALNTRVKDRIISLTFWEEVSTLTGLFEPFLEILKMFESDSPLLSTFYHRFTLLWGHLDKYGGLASKFQHIVSRYWQTIQHPAMYTAYLLDPRFPPSSLSGEATSEALSYIKRTSNPEVYGSIVDELTRFTARTGLFSDDAIWDSGQKCSPLDWWKGFIGSSCPNLQPVALRTLGFPASSGLSQSKREVFEKIQVMNAKYMSDEQANKAAVVYLNSNLSSNVEDAIANETKV
ncbi:hypothetical protein ON010_g13731 [Phytophthora cinnamomi]|nr:hypothetical protein ON010_g13731 [Phytophthora cinnamomi]